MLTLTVLLIDRADRHRVRTVVVDVTKAEPVQVMAKVRQWLQVGETLFAEPVQRAGNVWEAVYERRS